MIVTDTLEGIIDGTISSHYDVGSDVLYLRLLAHFDGTKLICNRVCAKSMK
jgi:hypothetical protein